ncbi:hypothetical protein Sjap_005999 [Stephania japonica]|uniref:Cytochrome b561 and DOMON domain-containing protein n=1 Tax=Stephania japonica TaxID=461633 RepID=A0AAP0PME3_9MAGN
MALWLWSCLVVLILLFVQRTQSQEVLSCNSSPRLKFDHCNVLPKLGSVLQWTYTPSKSTLSIAFAAVPPSAEGWIAWAINPTSTGMVGAQSLIAFQDGAGAVTVKTFNVSSYKSIEPSEIDFPVSNMSAEVVDSGVMRLFATIKVPPEIGTVVNQVWQVGAAVEGGVPTVHDFASDNLNSIGTLNLTTPSGSGGAIHGILNAVSWGVLFPVGVILARYVKAFEFGDPAWFYLHIGCQVSAYAIGVAGWATGLKLGSQSKGVVYTYHRNIGIALFSLATLQMFALFLRPKKEHKLRIYWSVYHRGVGLSIIVLGIINVFKGLDILIPEKKWRNAYTIALIVQGVVVVVFEAISWVLFIVKKKSKRSSRSEQTF